MAQMVHGQGRETIDFCGHSGGQRSRSHEAEGRFGGLADSSVSSALGVVAFVV